jgi:hypothetical protein
MRKCKTKRGIKPTKVARHAVFLPVTAEEEKRAQFKFRPLTHHEKKKFMSALDPDGRRMLEEIGSQATLAPRRPDLNSLGARSLRSRTPEVAD